MALYMMLGVLTGRNVVVVLLVVVVVVVAVVVEASVGMVVVVAVVPPTALLGGMRPNFTVHPPLSTMQIGELLLLLLTPDWLVVT